MNNFKTRDVGAVLRKNSFPGSGIIACLSKNGKHAVVAYFIMGRCEDCRNRVFNDFGDRLMVYPFDASAISDPSKVIYTPMRKTGKRLVIASSRHGDDICAALESGGCYEGAANKVSFAQDANFTLYFTFLRTYKRTCCHQKSTVIADKSIQPFPIREGLY